MVKTEYPVHFGWVLGDFVESWSDGGPKTEYQNKHVIGSNFLKHTAESVDISVQNPDGTVVYTDNFNVYKYSNIKSQIKEIEEKLAPTATDSIDWVYDGTENPFDPDTPLENDIKLLGKLNHKGVNAKFTIDFNGGTMGGKSKLEYRVPYGEHVNLEFLRPVNEDGSAKAPEGDFDTTGAGKFEGYYTTDPNGKNKWKNADEKWDDCKITKDITIYARYNEYPVTFHLNGGHIVETDEDTYKIYAGYNEGVRLPKDEAPTKKGYQFAGWFLSEDFAEESRYDDQLVTKPTHLYAKYCADKDCCKVSYELNGGTYDGHSSIESVLVAPGMRSPYLSYDPDKDGYFFAGWYSDRDFKTPYYPFITIITKDTTVYAKWIQGYGKCEVYYYLNGGTSGGHDSIITYVDSGESAPEIDRPLREGYAFDGFYTDEDLTNKYNGEPITQSTSLYAKWTPVTDYRVLTYELNGGHIGTQTSVVTYFKPGDAAPVMFRPIKEQSAFEGFYTDAELTTKYEAGTPLYENTTLYAKWEDIGGYVMVTYHLNGGTSAGSETVVSYVKNGEAAHDIVRPQKQGYAFNGFYTDEALTNKYDGSGLTETTDLYASWTDIADKILITYNLNGGTSDGAREVNTYIAKGEAAPEIVRPFKKDYLFEGFYLDEDLTIKYDGSALEESTTLYTKWMELSNYLVLTYDLNGGTSGGVSKIVTYIKPGEAAPKIFRPVKAGSAFDGYYLDNDVWEKKYEDGTPIYENTTLYAKWADITGYKVVTYELNGGTSNGMSTIVTYVKDGEPAPEIARPIKKGFAFDGFYTDEALTNKYDGSGIHENTTLYVKWFEIGGQYCLITYDLNGGLAHSVPEVHRYIRRGETIPELKDPYKEGYTYDGLYNDKALTDPYMNTPVYTDTTVYVKWVEGSSGRKGGKDKASEEDNHKHVYEWYEEKQATDTEDGELVYKCKICEAIQYRVPTSAYYMFNKNTMDKIQKAAKGATVKVETDRWESFHRMVLTALEERTDVTLTIKYPDKEHKMVELTIPAGSAEKLKKLFDMSTDKDTSGNGLFCGFQNMSNAFGK